MSPGDDDSAHAMIIPGRSVDIIRSLPDTLQVPDQPSPMTYNPQRGFTAFLVMLFLLVHVVHPAYAGMIGAHDLLSTTESTLSPSSADVRDLRQKVSELLTQNGVPEDAAMRRAGMLTEAELSLLQKEFNDLPAGQGALSVLGVLFLVLLVLEIVGVTNVFTRI